MGDVERLRAHPQERFAAAAHHLPLATLASRLRAEPHAPVDGHRQVAVFRRGPVTMLLFAFDRGGIMREHDVDGVVTIHVLTGRLVVGVGEERHLLASNEVLALAPGVRHTVESPEGAEMLLTVHRSQAPPA